MEARPNTISCIDGSPCSSCLAGERHCDTLVNKVAIDYIAAIGPRRLHTDSVDRDLDKAIRMESKKLKIAPEVFAQHVLMRVIEIRCEQNRSRNPRKNKTS